MSEPQSSQTTKNRKHRTSRNPELIDASGFRPNVGMVICNSRGQVFLGKRCGQNAWQLPQGGVDAGESVEQALFRELKEEVGLDPHEVCVLGSTKQWLPYRLPAKFIKWNERPLFLGQKQKWFLMQLLAADSAICLDLPGHHAEFDAWQWVSYWYPVEAIIGFKREVYCQMLTELKPFLQNMR